MSRSRRHRSKLPMEPVELVVDSLNHEGRGVARIEGKVAFVDGALPSERVIARYTGRRRQYDELRTESVLEASPHRVVPPCSFFGLCGGCVMQHLSPSAQREHKQAVMLEHLQHQAGLAPTDFELLPILHASSDIGYRRKARLGVRYVHRKGGALVGFREKYSPFITDMDSCAVLSSPVSSLLPALRTLFTGMEGNLALPQIELAVGEDAEGVANQSAFILRHLQPLNDADAERLRQFGEQHGIQWYLQSGGPDTISKFWPSDNQPRLYYHLPDFDLRMAFHPSDFTQVNGDINRSMIAQALELLSPGPGDRVLDLFCGLGNFTLPLARRAASVCGVEGSQEMVLRGAENAQANAIDNATFHAADLSADVSAEPWAQAQYDRILLDPPRSGALELCQRIGEFGASKIVYISCNPVTLARDAAALLKQGYRLQRAGIMDMFPHTAHVESIAEFTR